MRLIRLDETRTRRLREFQSGQELVCATRAPQFSKGEDRHRDGREERAAGKGEQAQLPPLPPADARVEKIVTRRTHVPREVQCLEQASCPVVWR